MDTESALRYLDVLFDFQYEMLDRPGSIWGENHVEFLYIQSARVLEAHQEIRARFFESVRHTLRRSRKFEEGVLERLPDQVPEGFIWFLAHKTKWREFSIIAAELQGTPQDIWPSNPFRKSSEQILEALSEDWEDKEFYESFVGKGTWLNIKGT